MKIVFACGGTGGHINPALAIAGYLKEKNPNTEIYFIGNKTGMEATLVKQAGYPFFPIVISGFQRRITPKNIVKNIKTVVNVFGSTIGTGKILREINPDLVVGTGGYVCGPVLRKAHFMGYKTATHEQNAFPGITTKMLSKYVDLIMLAMPEARKFLPEREYIDVGNPVRESVLSADREVSRKKLGMDDRPFILSYGGSLGADKINDAATELLAWHAGSGKYYHYHATGKAHYNQTISTLSVKGVDVEKYDEIQVLEYINNMDVLMSAADLVICRAGAITLSELEVQGKASILIPSPYVAENHQYHNAMTLVNNGAADILEEKDLTSEKLIEKVEKMCSNPEALKTMGDNAKKMAVMDSNDRIYQALMKLIG